MGLYSKENDWIVEIDCLEMTYSIDRYKLSQEAVDQYIGSNVKGIIYEGEIRLEQYLKFVANHKQ